MATIAGTAANVQAACLGYKYVVGALTSCSNTSLVPKQQTTSQLFIFPRHDPKTLRRPETEMTGAPKQSFIEACRNGDLPLAKSIMQDHNDFKAQQECYVYPDTLIKHAVDEAAWKNHAPVVGFLLDNGASITDSVVLAVSKSRDKTMLEEILKRGFDINTVEPGATLLRCVPPS